MSAATSHPPLVEAAQPVHQIPSDEDRPPEQGTALCLSGGGYRAMLFHLGTLWRLNELGWLPKLDRVSSVSGGSITAGVLAHRWGQLNFEPAGSEGAIADNFSTLIADPILHLAGETIDLSAGLRGIFGPALSQTKLRARTRSTSLAATRFKRSLTLLGSSSTRRTFNRGCSGDSRSRTCGTTGSAGSTTRPSGWRWRSLPPRRFRHFSRHSSSSSIRRHSFPAVVPTSRRQTSGSSLSLQTAASTTTSGSRQRGSGT